MGAFPVQPRRIGFKNFLQIRLILLLHPKHIIVPNLLKGEVIDRAMLRRRIRHGGLFCQRVLRLFSDGFQRQKGILCVSVGFLVLQVRRCLFSYLKFRLLIQGYGGYTFFFTGSSAGASAVSSIACGRWQSRSKVNSASKRLLTLLRI